MTNQEAQNWIKQRIDFYLNIWNMKSDVKVTNIPSKFNLKGKVAGYFCTRKEGNYFRWNLDIALTNQNDYDQTIGHEVAHLITRTLDKINNNKSKSHGWTWKIVMQNLNLKPKRCHDYKCEPARKTNYIIKYTCSRCQLEEKMTMVKYKNFLKNMNPLTGLTNYRCKCGQSVNVLKDCKSCVK